jgi:hypothetical protein
VNGPGARSPPAGCWRRSSGDAKPSVIARLLPDEPRSVGPERLPAAARACQTPPRDWI